MKTWEAYTWAGRDHAGPARACVCAAVSVRSRRQLLLSWASLLAARRSWCGALLGGWRRRRCSRGLARRLGGHLSRSRQRATGRVHSAAHRSERHGVFILLAIGESSSPSPSAPRRRARSEHTPLLMAGVLGIGSAPCACGGSTSTRSRSRPQHGRAGPHRRRPGEMVVEAYTYGHFPIVAASS
ncbi:hypothetical protein [Nonomuraea rubra]|uniref:hypothetical protein n=1 Tax=Nonomuraea rubra TaxID=46180 RepID=UPI0031E6BC48